MVIWLLANNFTAFVGVRDTICVYNRQLILQKNIRRIKNVYTALERQNSELLN
jgi:hypothetical protein